MTTERSWVQDVKQKDAQNVLSRICEDNRSYLELFNPQPKYVTGTPKSGKDDEIGIYYEYEIDAKRASKS